MPRSIKQENICEDYICDPVFADKLREFKWARANGYARATTDIGRIYMHTYVWFLHTGKIVAWLDHKDRDGLNNCIDNLREATRSLQGYNRVINKGSTLPRGVSYKAGLRKPYQASIRHEGILHFLGMFETIDEASNEYQRVLAEYMVEEREMNTFLPLPDFAASARCLDFRRLGKQRVEAMQILRTLRGESSGWASHPAVRMWAGCEPALINYGIDICEEWRRRGYHDTALDYFLEKLAECPDWDDSMSPYWLGFPEFHASHRAALLAKDPAHYGQFGWSEAPGINYVWPAALEAV